VGIKTYIRLDDVEAKLMQAVNYEQPITTRNPVTALNIPMEFIAYTVLILFALVLRVADLDIVPMSDVEAIQALPAYQVLNPQTPAQPQPAQSPIMFWLQMVSFALLGGDEFAARLPGIFGGIVLILMPLLFRERIGRERTFALSLLLALNPIAFVAARFADPVIWTMVFAFALLWAVWRYWESRSIADALLATVLLGALAFLTESGGLIFALILALSGFIAVWWTVLSAPEEQDTPGDEIWLAAQNFVRELPYQRMLLVLALTVVLGSTVFLSYPSALNTVAEVVRGSFVGLIQPYQPQTPPIMGILTLFVYDLWLVVLAVIAAVVLIVNRAAHFTDRFAIVCAAVAFVVLLLYRGSHPAYALYIAVPMLWLVARLIRELTVNYAPTLFSYDGYQFVDDNDAYWWVKWLLASIVLGLLVMLAVHWLEIGRGLLQLPSENILAALSGSQFVTFKASIIWFIISILFIAVGYFLAASVWGHTNSLQGFGLGLVLFMLGTGIGIGWNTAVEQAKNPTELWHSTTVTDDAYLLRDTLLEIADRDTKGFPLINLTILRDEAAGITDDSILAWLVRDFQNAAFVDALDSVQRNEIILMPVMEEEPDLGGSYVGQQFVIRHKWSLGSVGAGEWISWLGQRRVQTEEIPRDTTVLWLRIDVYDGIPALERMQG
jgi:hypothetical protein